MMLFDGIDAQESTPTPPLTFDPTPPPARDPDPVSVAPMTPTEIDRAEKLSERTFFLKVTFGLFGNHRKVARGKVEVDADRDAVTANKRLLDSPELEAIRKADAALLAELETLILPGFFQGKGIKYLPASAANYVWKLLKKHEEIRPRLVEKFLAAYPRLCEEAPGKLRAVYSAKDYPELEEVRERFYFEYRFMQIDTPQGLAKALSMEAFEAEKAKLVRGMANAADEIDRFMLETFAAMVERLKTSLTEGPDGKKKKLYDTAVTSLRDFTRTFDLRNVNNFAQLEEQVKRAEALIRAVPDVDALREVDSLRAKVRGGMEEVSTQLQAMVTNQPTRKFRADLED